MANKKKRKSATKSKRRRSKLTDEQRKAMFAKMKQDLGPKFKTTTGREVLLFHAAPTGSVKSIKKEGLRPSTDPDVDYDDDDTPIVESVFLAPDPIEAMGTIAGWKVGSHALSANDDEFAGDEEELTGLAEEMVDLEDVNPKLVAALLKEHGVTGAKAKTNTYFVDDKTARKYSPLEQLVFQQTVGDHEKTLRKRHSKARSYAKKYDGTNEDELVLDALIDVKLLESGGSIADLLVARNLVGAEPKHDELQQLSSAYGDLVTDLAEMQLTQSKVKPLAGKKEGSRTSFGGVSVFAVAAQPEALRKGTRSKYGWNLRVTPKLVKASTIFEKGKYGNLKEVKHLPMESFKSPETPMLSKKDLERRLRDFKTREIREFLSAGKIKPSAIALLNEKDLRKFIGNAHKQFGPRWYADDRYKNQIERLVHSGYINTTLGKLGGTPGRTKVRNAELLRFRTSKSKVSNTHKPKLQELIKKFERSQLSRFDSALEELQSRGSLTPASERELKKSISKAKRKLKSLTAKMDEQISGIPKSSKFTPPKTKKVGGKKRQAYRRVEVEWRDGALWYKNTRGKWTKA